MDATAGTASDGNGFDAALRALEDLETSVAQGRDEAAPVQGSAPAPTAAAGSVAPASEPELAVTGVLAFSDGELEAQPVAITAAPAAEIASGHPVPPLQVPTEQPEHAVAADAPAFAIPQPIAAAPIIPTVPGRLSKIAIGLGLASSVVSAAGLVIAERTIMSAQLVVASARERQEQLEQAGKLIRDLELVRDRQLELLKAQQAQLASTPVTSAELQHRMDILQEGIAKREPVTQVIEAIRQGQSETNSRLGDLGMKIDRVGAAGR